jgi:hypothetical protein
MFEITAEDIACLGDEALRTLIGRLCEAEVRKRGFSAAFITWGGNQNAADGGIDVRVALAAGSAIDEFVPRAAAGFQVKAQDMARAEILNEMRPKGVLRPSIQNLADQSGTGRSGCAPPVRRPIRGRGLRIGFVRGFCGNQFGAARSAWCIPRLNGAVAQEKAHVRKWVESARQQEAGLDKLRDDRFEW